jgi:RNA polymerase sigma-70 factor (ECF subfamily)
MGNPAVSASMSERQLLEAALQGDENAFGRLVDRYRGELHAHCYRMLGSVQDAEDALQDSLLRAWRGLPRFEGRSPLRAWLYRIATNACLKLIERRPKRVLPIDFGPPGDPHAGPSEPLIESIWVEPHPGAGVADGYAGPAARYEQRESVELAFIAALQHLPARQRAVLILRDVLGFSAGEVAEVLDTTTTAVHSALQRAHKTVDQQLPDQSQQATLRALGDRRLRELVDGFVAAWERGDVGAVVAMLAEDAALTMPPRPSWFRGRDAVGVFLEGWPMTGGQTWRVLPATVNGQLAFQQYLLDEQAGWFLPHALMVVTLRGDQIGELTAFLEVEDLGRFGLPERIAR